MKRFLLFIQSALLLLGLQSCIKDEALSPECDIVSVDAQWLSDHQSILVGNPLINEDIRKVSFTLEAGADRSALNPKFNLTPGASITAQVDGQQVAANGIVRDFNTPQTYTTHSQDGQWSKDYTVDFSYFVGLGNMNFDHYRLDASNRYYVWHEVDATNTSREWWSSGNGGYTKVGIAKTPFEFPTSPLTDSEMGAAVKLTTRYTGSFGDLVKMPIAAGSLFIGTFDDKLAMKKPRKATQFGLPILAKVPVKLEGYYKYTAGDVYTDKFKNVCSERRDTADIYAVVYEADPNNFVALDGDDVLTSERIVMMARIDNPGEPQTWTYFSEPFKFKNGYTALDPNRLSLKGYGLAIVATSSRQGAYFEGAADNPKTGDKGSVLYISQLKVVYE